MTLQIRKRVGRIASILTVLIVAGVATASHEAFRFLPGDEFIPQGQQMRRDAIIEAAETYMFQGFLAHGTPPFYNTPEELAANIEAVRAALHPDCQRTESGFHSGTSGDQIAEGFANPVFKVIVGIENLQWTVDLRKNEAFARFDLPTLRSPHPTLIGERFKVIDGLVTEIEAFFSIPGGSVPSCEVVEEIPCP